MREILIAGAFSMLVSLFGTPILIRGLAHRGYGQIIRDDGPTSHHIKRGTPTMGGIIIILASFVGFLVSHALTRVVISVSTMLVMGLVLSLGFVGFLDDWLKVSRQRSLGLTGKQKILGQTIGYSFSRPRRLDAIVLASFDSSGYIFEVGRNSYSHLDSSNGD
jgi:phospho-N-acetylmuramoyl-pentapeptide-transferase